jgi:hypothetical protein
MEQSTTDELLTEVEAAKILTVSKRTAQKWRIRGVGPRFLKLSDGKGPVRYRRKDLEAFIEARLRRSTSDDGDAS